MDLRVPRNVESVGVVVFHNFHWNDKIQSITLISKSLFLTLYI